MIISPLRPTFSRWKSFFLSPYTLLRHLQYEIAPHIKLPGLTFDFGGGKKAAYMRLLDNRDSIEGFNISPKMEPKYLADANLPWPVESGIYDNAISFNTFEHIEKDMHALDEFLRVLKPGGKFHIIVPYLYRVHASPGDYHRHTASGWESALTERGIPKEMQRIEPLVWDSMATGFSFIELTRLRFLRLPILLVGIMRTIMLKGERLPDSLASIWSEYALGYYISGQKPE